MSRIDAQSRIIRNLAVIRYQLEELARQGLYTPRFTEELVEKALNAVSNQAVANLNGESNNFPGIDLRSADETVGYQVTRHVTKAKYDKTSAALITELGKSTSRLTKLRDVYVVGFTCVANATIRRWDKVDSRYTPRIRTTDLNALLQFSSASEEGLLELDDVIQGFVNDWGRPRLSDAAQIHIIVNWLDRPAIRDSRDQEQSWDDMNTAMKDVRRLLARGVDDQGHPVTRPKSTFREPYDQLLQNIYDASHNISRVITPHLQGRRALTSTDIQHVDALRRCIQEQVTELSQEAGITPPTW